MAEVYDGPGNLSAARSVRRARPGPGTSLHDLCSYGRGPSSSRRPGVAWRHPGDEAVDFIRALGVRRTVAAVVGLLFMTLGSLILSGHGGWPITVGGEEIFPFPSLKIGATNVPIHAGERMLRVTANDSLAVAFQ